jgi:hypothetical protein
VAERIVKWSEELRRCFGHLDGPEHLADWERVKRSLPIGSRVSGRLVLKAPFGVWMDVGAGFPAILLITRFARAYTYDMYMQHGPEEDDVLDATVYLFNDVDRQLVLTQKALSETT